jgi:hypothetical protein
METKFTLDAVRLLYGEFPDNLREIISNNNLKNDDDAEALIKSLNESLLTSYEFLRGDFFKCNGLYYSSDDYVLTREDDAVHIDDAQFCEYYQQYTNESVSVCYIGRSERYYCSEAIEEAGLYEYRNVYYDDNALSRNDLVVIEGDVYNQDDVYYWESDGQYHLDSEPSDEYVRDYHNNTAPRFVNFTDKPKFYIGFEIEKEDETIKESILIDDFEDKCPKWRKEKDGSLNDKSGYELISPAFELVPDKIEEAIKENKTLLKHVNADIDTDTCGGHINISEAGLNGEELFAKIEGYTPLFHALYYKRIDKNYSKGKSNKDLKEQNEKYQSIRIHRNHLEYRIISAVPNIDTLMWRTRLLELILNNPTPCPKIAFFNAQTILKEHLSIMYQNGRFDRLSERIIEFTNTYEGIQLTNKNN